MRAEYGTAEGGSLAALTEAGADLHGTRIESFARSLCHAGPTTPTAPRPLRH